MKQNHKYLHIIIYLTYECNLRCSYCVITFEKIRLEDVLVADIDHFIKENRDAFETIFIEFIGGEPLLQRRQIDLFMTALSGKNIEFQITTNGTLLTSEIYKNTLSKMDHINLSYNENYFNNQKLFHQISTIIENKRNVDINFIYDPRKERSIIEENFLFVLKNGYRNINILPIVLIHEYSEADFANLIRFITMVMTYKNNINLTFLYYIQEKNNHFEFTIDPHGNVLGDNMGTAETFFGVSSPINTSIGKLQNMSLDAIQKELNGYTYINYLKNLCTNGDTKQSYSNLLLLSNLLKKYDTEISNRNRVYK